MGFWYSNQFPIARSLWLKLDEAHEGFVAYEPPPEP